MSSSPARPRKLVIVGTGGNSIDVLDAVLEINAASASPAYEVLGFLDDDPERAGAEFHGVRVLGPLSAAADFGEARFVFAIGSPFNHRRREAIAARMGLPPERWETIAHPTASVSRLASLGRGCVVLQHVTIASNVRLGDHVMVLPNSVISHDDVVGDFTCIAGGVSVSGGVTVGRGCYLGTNASIIGNVTIGDGSLVGMGAVVLRDAPAGVVLAGNPARELRRVAE